MGKNMRKNVATIFLLFITGYLLNVQGQDYTFSNHNISPLQPQSGACGKRECDALRIKLPPTVAFARQ